jgi:hypothetical protein
MDSPGSGEVWVVGSFECGDEPLGSGATELVSNRFHTLIERKFNYHSLLHLCCL